MRKVTLNRPGRKIQLPNLEASMHEHRYDKVFLVLNAYYWEALAKSLACNDLFLRSAAKSRPSREPSILDL
jgi:hypothetical protein